MINILCDKTWCMHNGSQNRVNKCWYSLSIEITNNFRCNRCECERTALIKMDVMNEDEMYEGCKYCSNKNCKYKKL